MVALLNALHTPRTACAAFVLVMVSAVFYTAHAVNLNILEDQAEKNAQSIAKDVGERVGVMNTVLASMSALHVVSNDLVDTNLQRFSDDVLLNAEYVRNLGRFEKIDNDSRDSFESRMSHNGYSDFSIAQLDFTGRFKFRPVQNVYYPITIAEPLRATAPGLIGVDLGAFANFESSLAINNEPSFTTLLTLPGSWPLKGDVMLFRQNSDSSVGFWLTVDLEQFANSLSEVLQEFDMAIDVVSNERRLSLFSTTSSDSSELMLTKLYQKKTIVKSWPVSPETHLVITLEKPFGFNVTTLAIACIAALLFAVTAILYTIYVVNRNKNEQEKREGLQHLSKVREKAEITLNSVPDAIITLDPNLRIVQINPAALIQFNTRSSMAIGEPIENIASFCRANASKIPVNLISELSALSHNRKKDLDVIPAGQNDDDFVLKMSLSSVFDYDGKVTGHVVILRDVSHERKLSKKLAYQANYDSLTGCTNRYFFENSLENLLQEIRKTDKTHTLLYIDLDQFKVINDTCGHRAGDQLLIELTKSIQLLIREHDILSRLGGDEFGVILVDIDQSEAALVAQRIYDSFQSFLFSHQGNTFSVTACIGVVHIDSPNATSKDVMASADIACYAAKDSGRNSVSVFSKTDQAMTERSEELNWLPRLQTALKNNEFRLHVQAVAALAPAQKTHPITHFEFLLRLADKDGSDVTPWQFIQAAERYDLMREIDRWVISNALQLVSECSQGAAKDCSFSINLSGQSAADPTLKAFIQQQIALHKVDASRIWFELTETAAISHFSVAVDLIKSIRSTGAKVALDDFGSGLSSFGYLKNLPIDVIKIDGQFVKEIVHNPIDREMVRAIHRVGQSMDIDTVAEFVENQEILKQLVRIGVNYAQGYHIGKPIPLSDAIAKLERDNKAA